MAIYELAVKGDLWGQEIVNRFHYQSGTTGDLPGGAQDLVDVFLTDIMPAIRGIYCDGPNTLMTRGVTARSIYDPTDFGENLTLALPGLRNVAGDPVPPFVALSFRSPRYKTGRNRANKRFAGVGETEITGNVYFDGAWSEALETALVASIVGPVTGATFLPQLYFLQKTAGQPDVYAMYPTEPEQRLNRALLTQMDVYRLTTQRSRITGHGQ